MAKRQSVVIETLEALYGFAQRKNFRATYKELISYTVSFINERDGSRAMNFVRKKIIPEKRAVTFNELKIRLFYLGNKTEKKIVRNNYMISLYSEFESEVDRLFQEFPDKFKSKEEMIEDGKSW